MALDGLAFEPPAEGHVDQGVLHNEQQQALLAALQSIPVEEREMIVLQYVLGWQMKRIAAHYNLRPNTASVKLRRALDRLRRQLRDQKEMEG